MSEGLHEHKIVINDVILTLSIPNKRFLRDLVKNIIIELEKENET